MSRGGGEQAGDVGVKMSHGRPVGCRQDPAVGGEIWRVRVDFFCEIRCACVARVKPG
jgi:hypothetical protein